MKCDSGKLDKDISLRLWDDFIFDYLPYMVDQLELVILEHAIRLSLERGSIGFNLPQGMKFGQVGIYFSDDGSAAFADSRLRYYKSDTIRKAVTNAVRSGFLILEQGNRYRETRYTVNLPGISKVAVDLLHHEHDFCSPETAKWRERALKDLLPLVRLVNDFYQISGIAIREVTPVMSTQTIKEKMQKALEMSADARKKRIHKLKGKQTLTVPDMFRTIVGLCEDHELPYRERRTGKVNGMARNFLKEKGTDEARSLLEKAISKWHLLYHSVSSVRLQKKVALKESFSFETFYIYRMDIEAWLDEDEGSNDFAISCKLEETSNPPAAVVKGDKFFTINLGEY